MTEKIRNAMLECGDQCGVNILKSTSHVNLCWVSSAGVFSLRIKKASLEIGNSEFESALNEAREHLK